MKKQLLAAGMAAILFASCGGKTPKADLKNSVDTLSYAFGVAQSNGLRDYAIQRLGIDSTMLDEFFKGIVDGASAGDNSKKKAYLAGISIGQQVSNQMMPGMNNELFMGDSTKTVNIEDFLAGFIGSASGKSTIISLDSAQQVVNVMMQRVKDEYMSEKYGQWKQENEQYLTNLSKKEGILKLSDGVYYEVIEAGKGDIPSAESTVKVNYEGRMINDSIFDSSYQRGEAATFPCNRVIPGWTEALTHMPVGSKWKVYISADKGYGSRSAGDIQPYSTLVFTIELLEIVKEKKIE